MRKKQISFFHLIFLKIKIPSSEGKIRKGLSEIIFYQFSLLCHLYCSREIDDLCILQGKQENICFNYRILLQVSQISMDNETGLHSRCNHKDQLLSLPQFICINIITYIMYVIMLTRQFLKFFQK